MARSLAPAVAAFVTFLLVTAVILTSRPSAVTAEEADGPVILTVSGRVAKPNRGPFDPGTDKFFGHFELEFEAARSFTLRDLARLEPVRLRADFPKGGPVHEFEGPSLAAVLEEAGAEGETLRITALDGYTIEVAVRDLVRQGAVLAVRRDGRTLGIGDFGPVQVVFARAEREDLKDLPDDNWVWSVYHIGVE